ncbi:MAG TPA: nucleotidyltransferase family protein [Thermopolyspora sp.]|jgi:hypothetical protein
MASHTSDLTDAILETLKHAGRALKDSGVRFALAGGCAAYARGAAPSLHDVDFMLPEEDVPVALESLRELGFRISKPPEDWLVKAYDEGDHLVDLIFRIVDRPINPAIIERCDSLAATSINLPVLEATDLVVSWLLPLSGHSCDFGALLPMVRALREQVDWDHVAAVTAASPYAFAFLTLLDRLGIASPDLSPRHEAPWP